MLRTAGLALLATSCLGDPPSPPTGGFPDSGKECEFAATGVGAPSYHIINNVTQDASGALHAEALNDANGIFKYKGLYHVMCARPLHVCVPSPRSVLAQRRAG